MCPEQWGYHHNDPDLFWEDILGLWQEWCRGQPLRSVGPQNWCHCCWWGVVWESGMWFHENPRSHCMGQLTDKHRLVERVRKWWCLMLWQRLLVIVSMSCLPEEKSRNIPSFFVNLPKLLVWSACLWHGIREQNKGWHTTFQIGKVANSNIGADVSKVSWPNLNPMPNDKIIIFEKFWNDLFQPSQAISQQSATNKM